MAAGDYPQYLVNVSLDNGVSFQSWISATSGLPQALEDQLAIAAAEAIRDFDWSGVTELSPPATSATVTISRQDVTNTDVPLT